MASTALSSKNRLKRVITNHYLWIVVVMLAITTFLHYFTPQVRFLPLSSFPLTRHAVERIIFILPIAGAAFAFRQTGGLITLAIAVLIMLPRIFLLSPYPTDALLETLATAAIGYLVIWMIETQEREKRLRQKAIKELETVNAIAATVSQSLDLDEILDRALSKVLEVMRLEAKGGVFLLDAGDQKLHLRAHHGLPPEFVRREAEIAVGECLCGLVAESGKVLLADDSFEDARHTRCRESEPHSHIIVPLKSRDRVLGVMFLYLRGTYRSGAEDRRLFASIGSQIGVAIENARLYENMRFYARQITRAQEGERKRIARELHDDTVQALVALSRRLDALAALSEQLPEPAARYLEQSRELTSNALRDVRRFSQALRPPTLDHLGLVPTLEGLTNDLMEQDGIEAELRVEGDRRRLTPEEELVLLRIAQEALNNVRRHSQASQVVAKVKFGPAKVWMTISDNGRGFAVPERTGDLVTIGKLGLIGMYERAQLLGGALLVQSEPGKGTTVIVDVPVQPRPKDEGGSV